MMNNSTKNKMNSRTHPMVQNSHVENSIEFKKKYGPNENLSGLKSMHDKLIKNAIEKHNPKKKRIILRKDLKCENCGKTFSRKKLLNRHIIDVHEGIKNTM